MSELIINISKAACIVPFLTFLGAGLLGLTIGCLFDRGTSLHRAWRIAIPLLIAASFYLLTHFAIVLPMSDLQRKLSGG